MSRVNNIISLFRSALAKTKFSNFAPYSDLHILFRAIASVLSEREVSINNVFNLFYIYYAKGAYLDKRSADYGIERLPGSKAIGYALVKCNSKDETIPVGAILSAPGAVLQYEVSKGANLSKGVEISLPIESLNLESEANLLAGTLLYSNFYPHVLFEVGRYRLPNGQAQQGLTGAGEKESDESLRRRLLQWLIRGSPTSKASLLSLVSAIPGVGKVTIQEHNPIPGYITVYVSTSDSNILNLVRSKISVHRAAGILFFVSSIQRVSIDISLRVSVIGSIDAAVLRSATNTFINRLDVGYGLKLADLVSYISQTNTDIKSVEILSPALDILGRSGVTLTPGEILIEIRDRRLYA